MSKKSEKEKAVSAMCAKDILEIQKLEDKLRLLRLAKLKNHGLPADSSDDAVLLRYQSLVAYESIMNAITEHANYIDRNGGTSKSTKGFAITINKKIKSVFGKGVGDMVTEQELECLARIREAIHKAIKAGEESNKTRREIKERVYSLIDQVYELYMNRFWSESL